jgi:hypothetical protein
MKGLQPPKKPLTLTTAHYAEARHMATARKKPTPPSGTMTDNMTDAEEEAFFQGIADDMTEAAQAAIAENDTLGIPSVSASKGKRVVRQPPKKTLTP